MSDTLELVDDDDDSDAGGVRLPDRDVDQEMTDALASTNLTTRSNHDGPVNLQPYRPPTVLGLRRPRPHSQEPRGEDDSRRLRFALDGDDDSDIPQYAYHLAEESQHPGVHPVTETSAEAARVEDILGSQPAMSGLSPQVSRTLESARSHSSSTSARERTPSNPEDRQADNASLNSHMTVDDPVAVDDPRWNYDFADFMDSWRFRALVDKSFPAFEPGVQPSVRLGRNIQEIGRRDVATRKVDMQGLHWQLLGPSRESALVARRRMHPSRHNMPFSNDASIPDSARTTIGSSAPAYQFRYFTTKHRASFPHHQLRNLLAAHSRSDIFYASGSKVHRTSLACTPQQDTILDLARTSESADSFRVTCLATSPTHKILLAGGFFGEYAMLTTDREHGNLKLANGFVTEAFNGLVTHIHTFEDRRSGLPQAAFCSNDRHLRLMDVNTARFTNSHAYLHPINSSATSPDRRLRLLVGDSPEALLTDAEKGHLLTTLTGHRDHAFAAAWAPNSIHLATGAQDSQTLVWDARNWRQPLQSLPSTLSCPRSLHWTDHGTLVVAEDDDIVSIYDSDRGFAKTQDLRFFGSIAGLALLDGGKEIVLANSDRTVGGLMSFEQTSAGTDNPAWRSREPISRSAPFRPWPRRRRRDTDSTADLWADVVV
ncbi:hypothetical protein B0A50_08569 [Salinomyces thailandicus]|uniref:Uncharacterized protein n=1 Tax=Salinomyces thailandicus TaxID=706561 RepID=A0A4U0TJC5_9PEZI|nr:hypothetical protein B0A50_08569 [Salinomyces thailandica]